MIAIIDYGMGNLRSVSKAFEVLGHSAKVTSDIDEITHSSGCVLPGVGAFGKCMDNLNSFNLTEPIKEIIKSNKPFLGICLGLQLLFEESEESPGIEGLSIIKGSVKKFPNFSDIELKVPQGQGPPRTCSSPVPPPAPGQPSPDRSYGSRRHGPWARSGTGCDAPPARSPAPGSARCCPARSPGPGVGVFDLCPPRSSGTNNGAPS